MEDVRFDFIHLEERVCDALMENRTFTAVFDRLERSEVTMTKRLETGDATISGLLESLGMSGRWTLTISYNGELEDEWRGFSGSMPTYLDNDHARTHVTIDGGGVDVETLIDMTASLVEEIAVAGEYTMCISVVNHVPVELYYRPPLVYYDAFTLSQMDDDLLSDLEHRLIE